MKFVTVVLIPRIRLSPNAETFNRVMHSDVFKLRRIGLKANRTTGYRVFISDWFYKHTHLKANRTTGF